MRYLVLTCALLLGGSSLTSAQTLSWKSTADGTWGNKYNWQYRLGGLTWNALPSVAYAVEINGGPTATISTETASCLSLTLGRNSGNNGSLQVNGGSLFDLTSLYVGDAGTGTVTQTGGTVTTSELKLADDTGSNGTYNLNGGTLNVPVLKAGKGNVHFNFGNGTLASAVGLITEVPMTLTGRGTVDVVGTPIVLNGTLSGTGGLIKTGNGTLQLGGNNTYLGGTWIQAGTVQLDTRTGLGQGSLTVNGGDLNLNGMDITVASLAGTKGLIHDLTGSWGGTSVLTVQQTSNTTYSGTIENSWFDGLLRRKIALTKSGAGTLTLTGHNTYTGLTTVSQGSLVVNGSLDSQVVVHSGATLGGSGRVGGLHVLDGGVLAPGNSPATLTVAGNLTLDAGALLDFELAGTTSSDLISMTQGTLSISGLDLDNFQFALLDGFGVGVYTLIDARAIDGQLGTNLRGMLGGLSAVLSISGNDVILTTAAVPEPATLTLLASGGLALLWLRRRRQS